MNKQLTILTASQELIKKNEVESNYMLTEMKSLLKENTLLKQENLILKQQIMLNKIEMQNLQLKLEKSLLDNHKKSIPSSARPLALDDDLQLKLDLKGYQKSLEKQPKTKNPTTLKCFASKEFLQSQTKMIFQGSSKRQPLLQMTQFSINSNSIEKGTEQSNRRACNNRSIMRESAKRQQLQKKHNGGETKKMSRKQQIMNKYRPYIQISDYNMPCKAGDYFIK